MKTILLKDDELPSGLYREAAQVLASDGLICLPCGANYRIVANLASENAVQNLFQSKHRTQNAPSLAFVADREMLERITVALDPLARRLIDKFWPGHLTLLVEPRLNLSKKLVRRITKVNGKLGVRVPTNAVARTLVRTFGGPLLVSSANIERKKGAYSPAQVRKNFVNRIDLFLDAGDLAPVPPSTVVDIAGEQIRIVRPGALDEAQILAAVAG
ncbi:MAG: threonylcarbamoyl-AMP synthase [Bradymonadales bacterium]|nr:threonylcarbamoyl-AMP synthase [Bradymonadales bacterium]